MDLWWQVTATKRPKNSALEADLDWERNANPPPVITEEFSLSIEELIKKRITEGQFDDAERASSLPSKAPREMKEMVKYYIVMSNCSFFIFFWFFICFRVINVVLLILQDENQSKKGLGEIYAVSIFCFSIWCYNYKLYYMCINSTLLAADGLNLLLILGRMSMHRRLVWFHKH